MKFKINFDKRAQAWCVIIAGQTETADLREVVLSLWQHDGYVNSEEAIWDMSKCAANFAFADISRFVDWLAESRKGRGPNKLALVAPSDLGFGNSRIYAGLQQLRGFEIKVFRDKQSVYEWLG